MSLKTMTASELKSLKRKVEAAIQAKVTERRNAIETELSKLSRFDGGGTRIVKVAATRTDAHALKARKKRVEEGLPAKASTLKQPKTLRAARKTNKVKKIVEAALPAPTNAEAMEVHPTEPLPIAPVSVTPISVNGIQTDLSAAA